MKKKILALLDLHKKNRSDSIFPANIWNYMPTCYEQTQELFDHADGVSQGVILYGLLLEVSRCPVEKVEFV